MTRSKLPQPRKLKDIRKSAVALAELQRAHYTITILALSLAAIVLLNIVQPLQLDTILGSIVIVLLILVALASLVTAFVINRIK